MTQQNKQRAFPLNVKDIQEAGTFSGYLSVFDVIDSYREVVAPGAFRSTLSKWTEKGRLPPLLWQHRSGEPLGPFTRMEEDKRGLYFEAQLLVNDIARAREAYALLKNKVIGGMSIGFSINPDGEEYDSRAGVVVLRDIDLWEGSLATFPANEAAQVSDVKGREFIERIRASTERGNLPTIRDFEDAMREVFAFSRDKAKALASLGLGQLQREAGSKEASPTLAEILEAVKQLPDIQSLLKGNSQ